MNVPLSVCVLARDEAEELERSLASVGWADEIVVVIDDRSRDASEEVARRLAHRVERRPYAGDVAQKRACVALAKHDWVLILDPDELIDIVPRSLMNGIKNETPKEEPKAS